MKGKFRESLEKYNDAVGVVDDQMNEKISLSVLLGNRSAAFFNLQEYELCLQDIDTALDSHCSESLELKLLERKLKCLHFLNKEDEFNKVIRNIREFSDEKLEKKREAMLDEMQQYSFRKQFHKKNENCHSKVKTRTVLKTRNKYFEGFSAAVEMQETDERGRFMIARDTIPVGTIIGAEDPIMSMMLPSTSGSQCYTCYSVISTYFLPCLSCCQIQFCSRKCWILEKKLGKHRLECGLQTDLGPVLKDVKGGDAVPEYYKLALLILSKLSVNDIVKNVGKKSPKSTIQKESDINSLFNLVGLESGRSLETDFWIFLVSSYFIQVLRVKGYFSNVETIDNDELSEDETEVGAVMVEILRVLQFNVHCIMQSVLKQGDSFSMESIGCGIYSSMAFLNHSCNPNTIKYWEGDRMVLVASHTIYPGQEVTDNYGMHFLNNNKPIRQRWLEVNN